MTSTVLEPETSLSCQSTRAFYRTANVDGLNLFYREAGPEDAPAAVLLHGFPSSSHMFRSMIPLLARRYHVIAPDYPGSGYSDATAAACSLETKSESVIPIRKNGMVVGEIDIDSHETAAFSPANGEFLEDCAGIVSDFVERTQTVSSGAKWE
jgi:pimeloyl-ACP methyl ester carboxylesterase